MRHLTIRHFGPLNEVDIELSRLNLIIGLQGSGKSCVMTTACFCAWTQKRIALRQSAMEFEKSLVPQFVHLDYVTKGIYDAEKSTKDKSYSEKQFVTSLLDILYKRNYERVPKDSNTIEKRVVHFRGKDFVFENAEASKQFEKEVKNHLLTDHAEIFLEEPESNLFPPTQFQLMDWILELTKDKKHKNFFFIATHSPYILNHLLQEDLKDFSLYLTYPTGDGMFNVKTASESDIQDIYDNGSDAFFNFDAFTH